MSFKFLVSLYEKINELEEKRSSLIDEMKKKESPTEERERLLRQVSFYFVFFCIILFVSVLILYFLRQISIFIGL